MDEISPRPGVESGSTASAFDVLPAELFLDILIRSVDFDDSLISQLHDLAQVSKFWFRSIISDSRFWRVIDLDDSELAPTVIRRNPNGPLTVRCSGDLLDTTADAFLEVALSQARRWDALELAGWIQDRHTQLLSCSAPALKTLQIRSLHDYHFEVTLSPTWSLDSIELFRFGLPWDSPSLAGLKALSIHNLRRGIPSLHQIVIILLASPALEWFSLKDIEDYGSSSTEMEPPETPQIISLPALQGLYFRGGVPSPIQSYLLNNIHGPKCRILHASIPFSLVQRRESILLNLAFTSTRIMKRIQVDHYYSEMILHVTSPPLPYDQGWRSECGGSEINLKIEDVPYTRGTMELFAHLFDLPGVEIALTLHEGPEGGSGIHFYNDYLAPWRSATAISFGIQYGLSTITALQFLASPTIENGNTRWPCPRLVCLAVERVDGYPLEKEIAAAVLELSEKRPGRRVGSGYRFTHPCAVAMQSEGRVNSQPASGS